MFFAGRATAEEWQLVAGDVLEIHTRSFMMCMKYLCIWQSRSQFNVLTCY